MNELNEQLYNFLLQVGEQINNLDAENIEVLSMYGVLDGLGKATEYVVTSHIDS